MQFRNTFVLSVSQFLGEPSPTDYRTEMNRVLWQIEHEHFINRGYVYSSNFISDDDALEEFRRKNPSLATEPRIVKFRSGRYVRNWVGNVVAVGNLVGFVEPLEATALQIICVQISSLADSLIDCVCEPTPRSSETTIVLVRRPKMTFGISWPSITPLTRVWTRLFGLPAEMTPNCMERSRWLIFTVRTAQVSSTDPNSSILRTPSEWMAT